MGVTLLDGGAQRRARAEEVGLTDELLEAPRANPHGERTPFDVCTIARRLALGVCPAWILAKEGIHSNEYRDFGVSSGRLGGRLGRIGCRTYDLDELVDKAKHQ